MQLDQSETQLPWKPLWLILPFFFWGTAMVAMKGVIPHTTPFFLAGVRLMPAGILLVLFTLIQGRPQPQGKKAWFWIGLFALVDGALFQGFLAEGLVQTGAGLGSVMIDSQPLAVALLCLWLFQEKIGLWGWLGLGLGVLGIGCIGLPEAWVLGGVNFGSITLSWNNLFQNGEWLMLLAALSMAVGTVLVHWVCKQADPVVATGWHMILGGLPLFMLSAVLESQQWQSIDLSGWLALSYSTVFGTAIAYGLFFYFASRGSLTNLSSLTFLTPVFALLFGNLFLGEILSPLQSGGVCLTLVSIYLVNQREVLAEKLRVNRLISVEKSLTQSSTRLMFSEKKAVKIPVEITVQEQNPEG